MYRDVLSHTPLLALPIFAMFVFLAVFVSASALALARRKRAYDEVANLPMKDECHE
ncbi:MAG TPA: hypothetical protein VGH28_33570 [Polyangiaceae bacterium]|jgi:cytochrome b